MTKAKTKFVKAPTGVFDFFKVLRYRYGVSRILVFFLSPLHRFALAVARQIAQKIKVNGRAVMYAGQEIRFPRNVGINCNTQVFWNGTAGVEPVTVRLVVALFQSSDVFLDIGSNFGLYSVLAQKVNSEIKVICFEPLQHLFQDNLAFHQLNQMRRQRVLNLALSDTTGEVRMYVPDRFPVESEISSASLEPDFFYNRAAEKTEVTVPVATLDSMLDTLPLESAQPGVVLKIDVEGHERSVLFGGTLFFKRLRPLTVVEIDRSQNHVAELFLFIQGLDYQIFAMTEAGYFRLSQLGFRSFQGNRDFLLLPNELATRDYFSPPDFEHHVRNRT